MRGLGGVECEERTGERQVTIKDITVVTGYFVEPIKTCVRRRRQRRAWGEGVLEGR